MPLLSTIGAAAARAFGFLRSLVASYNVANSLRYNSASSDRLSRTPASAGNRRTYTISYWLKRSKITYNYDMNIGTAYSAGAGNSFQILFDNTDTLNIQAGDGSYQLISTQLFRDVSAWYHIVVAIDTTQATASNRIKAYVNGSQITSFSTATYPTQNLDTAWNNTIAQYVGDFNAAYSMNGYMSEVYNIDGQALTPSSFGQTNSVTGIWTPIAYTGSFGTNGFYLNFANSADLGNDVSGNNNDFTVNGLTSIDQTTDTPTNNFATLNAVDNIAASGSGTLTEGNTNVAYTGGTFNTNATIAANKGKWYWETKAVANTRQGFVGMRIGFQQIPNTYSADNTLEQASFAMYVHPSAGVYSDVNGSNTQRDANLTYVDGDIIGIALDLDSNISYWYKNGTLSVTYDFSSLSSIGTKNLVPAVANGSGTSSPELNLNFGNPSIVIASGNADDNGYGNFEYDVPSGYYSWNTKNLNTYG